jgi:hypothetical protein
MNTCTVASSRLTDACSALQDRPGALHEDDLMIGDGRRTPPSAVRPPKAAQQSTTLACSTSGFHPLATCLSTEYGTAYGDSVSLVFWKPQGSGQNTSMLAGTAASKSSQRLWPVREGTRECSAVTQAGLTAVATTAHGAVVATATSTVRVA